MLWLKSQLADNIQYFIVGTILLLQKPPPPLLATILKYKIWQNIPSLPFRIHSAHYIPQCCVEDV